MRSHSTVTENIDQYVKDIEQYKCISVAREIELATKVHNGTAEESLKAREELITGSLRLVIKLAHDYKQYGLTFADLVQEGNKGLMTAADKFEPGHGAKFSCYATWWIKQSIRKAILNQSRTVRVPTAAAQLASRLSRVRKAYLNDLGRLPTMEECADKLGVSVQRAENIHYGELTMCSINERVNEDSDTTFEDMLHSETTEEQELSHECDQALDAVRELLQKKFTDLERYLIDKTYGLWGKRLPVSTIAQETGISEFDVPRRVQVVCIKLRPLMKNMAFSL